MSNQNFQTLGKYQIVSDADLSCYYMSDILKGFDPIKGQYVLLKVLFEDPYRGGIDPLGKLRDLKEILEQARQISHPNIAAVRDYGVDKNMFFVAMEFVDGQLLKEHVDENGPFDTENAASIMLKLLEVVTFFYNHGEYSLWMHPLGIVLNDQGNPKIIDLPILYTIEGMGDGPFISPSFKYAYVAPEGFLGNHSEPSAVFSAGAVFYYMLTGESPFSGDSIITIHKNVCEADLKLPSLCCSSVPEAFDATISKAMAKDPEKRYQSARQFAQAIQLWKTAFEG